MEVKQNEKPGLLHAITILLLVAGACVSLFFVLRSGRNNNSLILVGLFVAWVLSPFIALLAANMRFRNRPISSRRVIYILIIVISLLAPLCYSGVLSPSGAKPAGVFLIIPFISWIAMAITILIITKKRRANNSIH